MLDESICHFRGVRGLFCPFYFYCYYSDVNVGIGVGVGITL